MTEQQDEEPIEDTLRKTLRRLVIATAVLYLGIVAMAAVLWMYASQTRRTLCTFQSDLVQRVEAAQQFLLEHPDGFDGIPVAQLQTNIANQQRTIDALSGLHCG